MENESLLKQIEEQVMISFTGKINVLKPQSRQHIGVVFLKEGNIVDCNYQGKVGKKALYSLTFDEVESKEFHEFIVEPEIVKESQIRFSYTYEDFQKKAQERFQDYQKIRRLKPPGYLRLAIDPNFIHQSCPTEIDGFEFDVLLTIVDSGKVSDVYLNCPLYDYEITGALITLRKKKALKVIGP